MQETWETQVRSMGWEDSPGGGNFPNFPLGNPIDRRACQDGVTAVGTTEHAWIYVCMSDINHLLSM